jgi:flagellar biosynthetic protein FliO
MISAPALLEGASNGAPGPDWVRYWGVCALLILATAGIAWAFRRAIGKAWKTRAAQRSLQVLDVLPLGGKRKLSVVRCYDRTFVLGVGDKEISLVAELDPVIGQEQASASAATEADGDFTRFIETARARLDAKIPPAKKKADPSFEEVIA